MAFHAARLKDGNHLLLKIGRSVDRYSGHDRDGEDRKCGFHGGTEFERGGPEGARLFSGNGVRSAAPRETTTRLPIRRMRLNPTRVIQLPHAMNLLCGTDFSPNASDATQVAAGLARQFRDTLTLVHASVPPADDGVAPEVWSPVEAALRSQLESQAALLRDAGLAVETRLESGSPVDVLARLAEPGRCRMIVLSSIGRVALTRVLLGSTADRVAESAAVPTLVVRRAIAFADWRKGRHPLRLFVAADFSAASDAALQFARSWSHAGPIELVIGHVADPEREQERRAANHAVAHNRASLRKAVERDLRERASLFADNSTFELALEWSSRDPAAVLIELAKKSRADLIVTGSHQIHGVRRLWHHSVSRALLADAGINVAVVPGGDTDQPGPIPPMTRVLVATDLSPLGNRAIPAACALLSQGGVLRLLHIVPASGPGFRLIGGSPPNSPLSPGEQRERTRHLKQTLSRLVPAEAISRGISVEPAVLTADDIPDALIKDARQFGAHALCLSSHGRGAALQLLMGSVAEKVLRHGDLPVHVVLPARD